MTTTRAPWLRDTHTARRPSGCYSKRQWLILCWICWGVTALVVSTIAACVLVVLQGCTWTTLPDGSKRKTFLVRERMETTAPTGRTVLTSDCDLATGLLATAAERAPDAVLRLFDRGSQTVGTTAVLSDDGHEGPRAGRPP